MSNKAILIALGIVAAAALCFLGLGFWLEGCDILSWLTCTKAIACYVVVGCVALAAGFLLIRSRIK